MPFNGAGMFVRLRNWVEDATAGIKIRADYHDIEDDNFAGGISQCIARDGQSTVTNNIPMNSKRIVALADPVDLQDASTKAYADTKLSLAGGTVNGNVTITGALGVGGTLSAAGYLTRTGLPGPFGGNYFNFNWTGSRLDTWVDNTNIGTMATTAYVEDRAQAWAASYAAPKVNRAGDTMTGNLISSNSGPINSGGTAGSFEVRGSGNAAMSFHCVGQFAANFGISTDGNFYMGGWSHGNVFYKFWTTRELNPIQNGRLTLVGDFFTPKNPDNTSAGGLSEPWNGSVVTGLWFVAAGDKVTTAGCTNGARSRYLQLLTPGGWFTVSYA
jgi:hypothetical protein